MTRFEYGAWALRLMEAAPAMGWTMVRPLAIELSSRPSIERLMEIGDALAAASVEVRIAGAPICARDLAALADLVREHAGLLPARVWPGR